jgi:hypothetical protein
MVLRRSDRLVERRSTVGKQRRSSVVEAAHTMHMAIIVIERAIFLHEDDDVFDVVDGTSECRVCANNEREGQEDREGHVS